jgi:hypothetical protein
MVCHLDDCTISLHKQGSATYQKMSFPVHCGVYSEIDTKNFTLHFNLDNEIIRCRAKCRDWGHPHEWLKRTRGNDWVYYSTGGYTGVFEAIGEYYLPNFTYPTNSMLGGDPFSRKEVRHILENWFSEVQRLHRSGRVLPPQVKDFLADAVKQNGARLKQQAQKLFTAVGGRVSVLPPDARHVDYNLIPLTVSRGCLYKCTFCKVKNNTRFQEKTAAEIDVQLDLLGQLYGPDLANQSSLFLGEHDGLQTSHTLILEAVDKAFAAFSFNRSYLQEKNIFMFGSVSSLLNCNRELFEELQQRGANCFINIGLESADQETLDMIGKPVSEKRVAEAFQFIQEINDRYSKIEITCNFIMDDGLPENHYPKIIGLIRDSQHRTKPKGTVYFSPLSFNSPSRARLFEFHRLKILSRFPTYLYIIQRL